MKVGARTDIGRVRPTNQDGFRILESVFAVADGMGGHQAGEVASRVALDVVEQRLMDTETASEWLRPAIEEANREILRLAQANADQAGMGTTLTLACIATDTVHIAHVGDSRAYLLRDGVLRQVTRDHSVVGELLYRGEITPQEAMVHPQRHLVTRALGTSANIEVDLHVEPLLERDRIILCTDGLTSLVGPDELTHIAVESLVPQDAADALVEMANVRGGYDNITVVVVSVDTQLHHGQVDGPVRRSRTDSVGRHVG